MKTGIFKGAIYASSTAASAQMKGLQQEAGRSTQLLKSSSKSKTKESKATS